MSAVWSPQVSSVLLSSTTGIYVMVVSTNLTFPIFSLSNYSHLTNNLLGWDFWKETWKPDLSLGFIQRCVGEVQSSELPLKSPPCHSLRSWEEAYTEFVCPHLDLSNFLTLDNLMVVKWVLLLFPFALLYSEIGHLFATWYPFYHFFLWILLTIFIDWFVHCMYVYIRALVNMQYISSSV